MLYKNISITGIDPGYRHTGLVSLICNYKTGKVEFTINNSMLILVEKPKVKPKILLLKQVEDYQQISDELSYFALDKVVGLEFYQSRGSANVATVRGVILKYAFLHDCTIIPLAPQTIKIRILNNRSATKKDIKDWACETIVGFEEEIKKYSKEFQEHICDAAAIAYTAYFRSLEN